MVLGWIVCCATSPPRSSHRLANKEHRRLNYIDLCHLELGMSAQVELLNPEDQRPLLIV